MMAYGDDHVVATSAITARKETSRVEGKVGGGLDGEEKSLTWSPNRSSPPFHAPSFPFAASFAARVIARGLDISLEASN